MVTTTQDAADRWRGFFDTIVPGPRELVDTATNAAVRALAAGASRDDAIAAGLAAARAELDGPDLGSPTKPANTSTVPSGFLHHLLARRSGSRVGRRRGLAVLVGHLREPAGEALGEALGGALGEAMGEVIGDWLDET